MFSLLIFRLDVRCSPSVADREYEIHPLVFNESPCRYGRVRDTQFIQLTDSISEWISMQ